MSSAVLNTPPVQRCWGKCKCDVIIFMRICTPPAEVLGSVQMRCDNIYEVHTFNLQPASSSHELSSTPVPKTTKAELELAIHFICHWPLHTTCAALLWLRLSQHLQLTLGAGY
jgi:hypothetical protein